MKNLILILTAVFSLISISASAAPSDNMSVEQKIESLQQEVQTLREIILNSQANNRPACLVTGERCSSAYDVCCNSGRYCGNAGGVCP